MFSSIEFLGIARLIKVTETDSPYFIVISPLDVGNKVAPGMDKVFMLQFTTNQKKVAHLYTGQNARLAAI